MECVARIQGSLFKGIKTLAFSNNGKYLAATALDDYHCVAVYEWNAPLKAGQSIKPIATGKGTRANILSLGFNSADDMIVATCIKEVCFITFNNGVIKCSKGSGWGKNPIEAVLCQASIDGTLFTGTFSGSILQWSGKTITSSSLKAHTDGVHAMSARTA
jgi:hypothetical protein